MLKILKSTRLTGEVKIENETVMTLTADISTENLGNSYMSQSIVNQELYKANRVECRLNVSQFQEIVYSIEDKYAEEINLVNEK